MDTKVDVKYRSHSIFPRFIASNVFHAQTTCIGLEGLSLEFGCRVSKQLWLWLLQVVIACIYAPGKARNHNDATPALCNRPGPDSGKPLSANVIGLHILQRLHGDSRCLEWPEITCNYHLAQVISFHVSYHNGLLKQHILSFNKKPFIWKVVSVCIFLIDYVFKYMCIYFNDLNLIMLILVVDVHFKSASHSSTNTYWDCLIKSSILCLWVYCSGLWFEFLTFGNIGMWFSKSPFDRLVYRFPASVIFDTSKYDI